MVLHKFNSTIHCPEFRIPCVRSSMQSLRTFKGLETYGSLLTFFFQMEAHKETMGKYCAHILADYLNVISGYNHGGSGLRRSVIVKSFHLAFRSRTKHACEDAWTKNGVCRGGGGCSFQPFL